MDSLEPFMSSLPAFDIFQDVSPPAVADPRATPASGVLRALARAWRGKGPAPDPAIDDDEPVGGGANPAPDRPVDGFRAVLSTARRRRRGLVVVLGAWWPGDEVIGALVAAEAFDPMLGSIQPRFASALTDEIAGLPHGAAAKAPLLPRAALRHLPENLLAPEFVSALFYLPASAVQAADVRPGETDVVAALDGLLTDLRRRGFRTLVKNRIVASFGKDPQHAYPSARTEAGRDPARLQDRQRSQRWLDGLREHGLEAILSGAFADDGRPRLLLDCRGLRDRHNGTSRQILGFLGGLEALHAADRLEITVLAGAAGAQFHQLKARFGGFRLETESLEGRFLAAIAMDQPWSIDMVDELHRHAVILVFNFLDTIAWDVIYAGPEGAEAAWRLVALTADGLLFNSSFTRERFTNRFEIRESMPTRVTHHSMRQDEYVAARIGGPLIPPPYVMVIGNGYEHKAVAQTVSALVAGFPSLNIVAFGCKYPPSARVTSFESGLVEEADVAGLIAHAEAIVYPSFYEGFGLPVIEGLSYGRTVIVRRSALWREIRDRAELPGALVEFVSESDLIVAVGRALHGLPSGAPEAARDSGEESPGWADCARQILDLLDLLRSDCDGRRWLARDLILGLR